MTLEHESAPAPARARTAATAGGTELAVTPSLDSVAGVLALQRMAGNAAVEALLRGSSGAAIQRGVGWTGVDPKSWNAGDRGVQDKPGGKGVKRIPVEGIDEGRASGAASGQPDVPKQDDANETVVDPATGKKRRLSDLTPEAAGGVKAGRAIVLIPNALPEKEDTVEVLFHLHGFTTGGRGRGKAGTDEPEDVAFTRIAQQLEASGRAMIGILPQGTRGGGFWRDPSKIDLNKYIDEALALVPTNLWPGRKKRNPGGIVLSAHSGGGDELAKMMKGNLVPGAKAGSRGVEGLLLFDALHGWGPGAVADFLKSRLAGELAHLHGIWTAKNASAPAEVIADEQTAWLQQSGFRFRGFASAGAYFDRYKDQLKPLLASWFTSHQSQLGGTGSCVYQTLRANVFDQSAVPAGTDHEHIVGGTLAGGKRDLQHLLESISELPGGKLPVLKDCKSVPAKPPAPPAAKPRATQRPAKAPASLARAPAGWKGAPKGSPNAAVRTTAGTSIRRVPVQGIAEGRGPGNGLVLIPEWLPALKTVEVLFHLHGHQLSGYGVGYATAEDETVYRLEQALDQFSQDKKRPIVAVLPQGGSQSEFGKDAKDLNAGVYIQQALAAVPADAWPNPPAPQAGGVILSGHSGAGGRFASMFGTEKMPGGTAAAPGHLEGFFSFDTINGKTGQKVSQIVKGNEYKQHLAFVVERLDADLRMLQDERAKAVGQKEEQIQTALEAKLVRDGFRFRAFYTGSPHLKRGGKPGDPQTLDPDAEATYADRYFLLKGKVDEWFDAHAGDLGGKGSKVYAALRANYTIEAAGTEHMQMLGGVQERKGSPWQHENMRTALGGLPTAPQGGP